MSGQDDPGLATLSPDSRLLRTFDLGAVAFRALAAERPLAILIDDLQWSDEDSLRLLRYVVRTDGASPIFLMFAIRPEEFAVVTEAVNLVADMGRDGRRPPPQARPVLAAGDARRSWRRCSAVRSTRRARR